MKKKLHFTGWSIITAGVLLAGVLLWFVFANRLFPTFAEDFSYRANILSYDNFFDTGKNDFSGDILSKTRYSYRVEKKENNILTIRNIFDVRKPSGDPIFAVERLYGINQITGEHTLGYGDKNRSGYLFGSKNAGEAFTYWHINYDTPALMEFKGKEEIEGLTVYRYESNFKADQTANLTFLPGVPKERGVDLDINLQLWIEPTTGYLIKYEDHTTCWFYDMKSKKRIHPWNRFHNQFEETSISNQVQIASLAKEQHNWWHYYFPLSVLLLVFIVLLVGYHSDRKSLWRPYFVSGLILFTGLMASVFLYQFLQKSEVKRLDTIFTRDCESIRISVQRELERSVDVLSSIKSNYASHKEMTRDQYGAMVSQSLKNSESILAMAWIPKVPLQKRDAFELKVQKDGFPDFKFTELKGGNLIPAGIRDNYFPIYYIEPSESNKNALGYDFGSNPERKIAIEKAAATGEITATDSLILVQQLGKKSNNKSFLIIAPVYEDELGLSKNHVLHSYLSAGINIQKLMEEAISRVSISSNVGITVIDLEAENEEILFSNSVNSKPYQFEKKSSLQVANRLWQLKFQSSPEHNDLEAWWFTIILPIVLALMTFILGIFVFRVMTDDSKKLRESNTKLVNEITERKKAEEIIQNKTNQLADAQKLAHFGSWEWDVLANKIEWSDELYRIYGLIPQEFEATYESYLKFIHPDEREYVNGIVQQAFIDQKPFNFIHQIVRLDGTIRIMSSIGNVFADRNGNTIKMAGTGQDITEMKKSERALKESEQQIQTIFKNAPDAVVMIDEEGKITRWNPMAETIFGWTYNEVIGKKLHEIIIPERFRAAHQQGIKHFMETKEGPILYKPLELQAIKKDRTEFDVGLSISPTVLNGKYFFIGFLRDITEKKLIAMNLEEHAARLEVSSRLLESQNIQLVDFCNIVSHNLRAPLVNISMLANYMEQSDDEAERKEMLEKMKSVVAHLNEVFDELVESVQVKMDSEVALNKINLKDCVNKILIGFKSQINFYKADVQIDFEDAPVVYYPQKYIDSILSNLISNALKYKSPDRDPIIKIKTEMIDGNIVLSVADNGLGIDLVMHKNNLFKIRKVFHKHPDAKGFGLFMTKTQIEAMGGKIWIESEPNKGSTFFIEFIKQSV